MSWLSAAGRSAAKMRLFPVPGVAALAMATLVMAAAPAAAGGPVLRHPPRNIDVSQMAGNHAEDAVAINPTDPRNVVAVSVASSRQAGLFEGVTFDGGRTWHRTVIGTGGALGEICCDEALAWDHYGNLWLSYLINENRNAVIAVSTDGGLTFTRVKEIVAAPPGGATQPDADQPHIAVGAHSVWVSYASFATVASLKGFIQASGAPVSGLGRYGAFSSPETVPAPRGQNDYGGVAVGPDGQVTVIWETDIADRCCSDVYTAVDPDGFGPRGFGTLRLLGRSNVGGFFTIPAQPGQGAYTEPQLAQYDGPGRYPGRLYAVWSQTVPKNSDNLNTMFRYSSDNGKTWSRTVQLSDAQTVNSEFLPALAVDQATGNVVAGWYDCRNAQGRSGAGCNEPDSYAQFWATYSTDGGTRFVPDFQVSQGTSNSADSGDVFDYGSLTHVAAQSGLFYPVWSDNSDSTGNNPNGTLKQLDLYTARIAIP